MQAIRILLTASLLGLFDLAEFFVNHGAPANATLT
jgi:hypothetical protein